MKPILFSTPMVQAIIDGHKTMTRRIIKPQPIIKESYSGGWVYKTKHATTSIQAINEGIYPNDPPYKPSDILWVRETWCTDEDMADVFEEPLTHGVYYKADVVSAGLDWVTDRDIVKWRPSIFMPCEAARIFLRVNDVRAERVWDITEQDCYCEGIIKVPLGDGMEFAEEDWALTKFQNLWDSLNAKRGYSWASNPWVWVISFERIP